MKAETHVSRTQASEGDDYITIEFRVDYPEPGIRLKRHRIELSLADFALALTGRGGIKGEYTYSAAALDGGEFPAARLKRLEDAVGWIRRRLAQLDEEVETQEPGDYIGRTHFEGKALLAIRQIIDTLEAKPCDESKGSRPARGSRPAGPRSS